MGGKKHIRPLQLAALAALLGCLATTLPGHDATSQPARTIRLINPFPPGGTADIIARIVTEHISRKHGATFVIENRPGGGSVIGADVVARAAPDGNTLLINTAALLINAHLRKLSFDPLGSFAPVCNLTQSPHLLFVTGDSPYRSLDDLVTAARAKPGEVTLGATGPATTAHIGFESFRRSTNVSITFVPFPGNAPTLNAVLGGHVTAGIANYADLVGHFQTGKLRALVTLTPARIDPMPELPAVAEAGHKAFEYVTWFGIFATGKSPEPALKQLAAWLAAARQAPEVEAKLHAQGLFPQPQCGADFAALVRREYEHYGRIIRETGIKGE